MLQTLTRRTLDEIRQVRDRFCVSFFLPTHRHGPQAMAARARLDGLLEEITSGLQAAGATRDEVAGLLGPVRGLTRDPLFWKSQGEGLALFVAPGKLLAVRLGVSPSPFVEVGRRFVLSPLIPALPLVERFYVLALALRRPRVLEVTPEGIRRLETPGMPSGIREVLGYEQYDTALQVHTASPGGLARQAPIVHGHGDDDSQRSKTDIVHYFRRVADALALLPDGGAPIVLAAVADHEPLFRQALGGNGCAGRILPAILSGSPERVPDGELASGARQLTTDAAGAERARAILHYRELGDRTRALHDPEGIVAAAAGGRVDTLFVVPGARRWGTFDPASLRVHSHAVRESGDDDLVDLAVSLTLAHGGAVFATPRESAPNHAPLAAILRY